MANSHNTQSLSLALTLIKLTRWNSKKDKAYSEDLGNHIATLLQLIAKQYQPLNSNPIIKCTDTLQYSNTLATNHNTLATILQKCHKAL